ncbi:hypothetical protein HanRHA438_Chr12g0574051 [Helianthus annuus]|nr:hypothetical protein HanHA300_Chr12g0461761 [Helianthus annuus]KAJ0495326.1 hypothetical protein HanIR_Chr12g0607591 [Helianthus annuus]KAJ0506888.1 hypothetical protein HanHA89_Chr12g0487161 [Helianthus annuus]KAJ0676526.1 hypothetical protein HanLR1_Chr12g0463781 [Helianthus annuus]KAJ0679734.1 hypothetical protein HanOQP8_Chr12g0462971 [Helianthus annuus]
MNESRHPRLTSLSPNDGPVVPLLPGFEPYNSCIPSTSSLSSSTFLIPEAIVGNIIAFSTDECPNPNKCPISCTATDSRSISAPVPEPDISPTIHVSSLSRCNKPLGGANA